MRLIPILVILSVALATAGCFGKDDENGDPPTNTTPRMTPTPTGATPTATPTSATPATPTTPSAPPARELCAVSKDFASNVQPGAPPTTMSTGPCGTVPAGYTKIAINGNFTSAAPATLANAVTVKVADAAGTAVLTCAGPGPGPSAPTACTQEASVMAGDYTLIFEGGGNVMFAGSVTIA